jgi:UDP-glucose 4-epimerase
LRVLVVGGAGYIGSVTVAEALAAGHEVTVLDNLSMGHRGAVSPGAELVVADLEDEERLDRLFSERRPEAVVYYGGFIAAGESMEKPGLYFANNVVGIVVLLNVMAGHNVRRLVFSSSAAVYGDPDSVPIHEDAAIRPANPYGESKVIAERLFPWYDRICGIRYVALRYFNAAGATDTLGEDHRPETHLIPRVLSVALGRLERLELFGGDYPTPDGTCVRDYIHVSDLARAHLLALARCEEGSGVYNLGNGRGFSNREVVETARRVTGHAIPVVEGPRRPGDPAELVASAERARRELGWEPQVPRLEEIIESAWRWHLAHPDGYAE